MLDQRDDDGVEDIRLLRRRHITGQLEPSEVAEIHLAEDFVREALATYNNAVDGAPRDV